MSSQWGAYASASTGAGLNPGAWRGPRAPPLPVAATCPTVAWSGELHGPQPQMPRLSCTVWNPPPPTNVIWKPFENRRYIGNFSPCNSGPVAAVPSLGNDNSNSSMAVHSNYYNPVPITPPPGFHQATGRNELVPTCSYPYNFSIQPPPPTLPPFYKRNLSDDPVAQPLSPFYKRNLSDDPVAQPLSQRWEFKGEPWKKRKRGRKKRWRNTESAYGGGGGVDGATGGDYGGGGGGGVSVGGGDSVGGDGVSVGGGGSGMGSSATVAKTAAQFVCEPCSKEYKTEETYRAHISAHKKIHILPPELNFTSPEDIRSWREKRRKNYPTTANVAKKRRLEGDRQARGEVVETPLYKYVSHLIGEDVVPASGGGGRGRGGRRPRLRQSRPRQRKRRPLRFQQGGDIEGMDNSQGGGTLAAVEGEGRPNGTSSPPLEASSEDHVDAGDSFESQRGEVPDLERGSGENLLGAIMADVSSQQTPWQSAKKRKRWKKPRRRMQQKSKSKSKRKDGWVVLSEVGERKPTLLEKLLAPEIRKEQNAILQCIRHTVQENFFMPPITGNRNKQGSRDGETSNSEEREQEDGLQTLEDVTFDPPRIKVEDSALGEGKEKEGDCLSLSKDRSDDQERNVTEEDFCWVDEHQHGGSP